jgi:hypothetical protein
MLQAVMERITFKKSTSKFYFIIFALILLVPFITPYMILATASYLVLVAGYSFRRTNSKIHAILMSTAVITDLSLVGILELQRQAVKTAMSFTLTPLQQVHILCSSLAVGLYLPILATGLILLFWPNLRQMFKPYHAKLGTAAFIFRTLGFFLMFSMLGRTH